MHAAPDAGARESERAIKELDEAKTALKEFREDENGSYWRRVKS